MFIAKTSNQEYDSEHLIEDSVATSHMVNSEENMMNLKNDETRITIGDIINLTRENVSIGTDTRDVTEKSIA